MNKKNAKFLILALLALLSAQSLLAQYDNIRVPQPPDEIALIKKSRIMGETQWSMENNKKVPYYTRAFDREGRVVISADFYHRDYYMYDDKSNIVSYLDSLKTDKGFEVNEYKFHYDEHGLLKDMTGPKMKSTFIYDPVKKVLIEKLIKNDTTYRNIYSYDDNLRLKDALYLNAKYKPMLHTMKNYAADGRLFNEVYAMTSETNTDSTLTVYMYNENKQLFKKQRFKFQVYYFNLKGIGRPDHSASHYDDATTNYDLDDKGRPVAEEFTIKGDKLNYRYNTWTYNANGLYERETFKVGMAEPKIVIHEYIYY